MFNTQSLITSYIIDDLSLDDNEIKVIKKLIKTTAYKDLLYDD